MKRTRERAYILKKDKPDKNKSWGTNQYHYQSGAWRKLRKQLLKHTEGWALCFECQRIGIINGATVIDHIDPVPPNADKKVFWEYSRRENLQPLCASHHNSKTNKDNK